MDLSPLQLSSSKDLLDFIDYLRSYGLDQHILLPEIIVCGEQSAGKSSVLEGLSRWSFPARDGVCTRFVTELVLRQEKSTRARASILPGEECSEDEIKKLRNFNPPVDISKKDLSSVIEKATEIMGLSDSKGFSKHILRVEICGPEQPNLTLVDLPGLFRAGNKTQAVQDAEIVKEMNKGYMEKDRSIILAIISAKMEIQAQEVLELAKDADPTGSRTMGIITKPDLLDVGSENEKAYFELSQNADVIFRLGWYVLKNRNFTMRDVTSEERDNSEVGFFSEGIWSKLPSDKVGIKSLGTRLSSLQGDWIRKLLPSIQSELKEKLEDHRLRLQKLGLSRLKTKQQRHYLSQLGQDFGRLARAAVDGTYTDPFFESVTSEEGYKRRLRAVLQNSLTEFKEKMVKYGHTIEIFSEDTDNIGPGPVKDADRPQLTDTSDKLMDDDELPQYRRRISRSAYIDEVKVLMKRGRGRELPGTFNPLIINDLFTEQCRPWREIANTLKEYIVRSVYYTTREIIDYAAAGETADAVFRIISDGIEELKGDLDQKTDSLLLRYLEGHAITYCGALGHNVEEIQMARRVKDLKKELKLFFNVIDLKRDKPRVLERSTDLTDLSEILAKRTEANMEYYSCSQAVDYMHGYYNIALEHFVDEMSGLVIEDCLIQKLPNLLNSNLSIELEDEEIKQLVGESEAMTNERNRCSNMVKILEKLFRQSQELRIDVRKS